MNNKISDVSNIVPVLQAEKTLIAPASPPKLVYQGGPLLTAVEIVPIFWGDAWTTQPAQKLVLQYLYLFLQYIVTSPFMDQLQEYSTSSYQIGHGSVHQPITIAHTFHLPLVLDNTIQNMIKQQITAGRLPSPNPNTLFFVYVPPGVKVQKDLGVSCVTFCGYHDVIDSNTYYAVVPYTDCSGCMGGLSSIDALYSITSHELAEAITDPIPGKGWYDASNGEIGDICSWQTKSIPNSSYVYQKEWSNKSNTCV